ncbi:MAG: GGDEF domain-containing phosphodiesterase [Eubacteriales bacterium]|nr:GGDEF domain-containing phosphodiesterase [Eubacteriales bacterium]
MKKSKKKRIKKLKRIHILPHIILLMIFVTFFSGVTIALAELFFAFLLESHLDDSYQRAQAFADLVEEQNKGTDEITDVVIDEWGVEDYGIYDNTEKRFVILPKREIDMDSFVTYDFNDRTVYFDFVDESEFEFLLDEDVNINSLQMYKFLNTSDLLLSIGVGNMNAELVRFHAWIDQPIKEGKYSVYYSSDIVLKTRDLMLILAFVVMMGIVVSVPLLLYIITLIISIFGQRKSAKLLFYDAVTGGKNWLDFEGRAEQILKRNKRGKRRYVMVSLRMERYQSYCACYGALEGEKVIEQMNRMLQKTVKKRKELFARYAEAEFGLLLLMEEPAQVTERMELIRNHLVDMMKPRKIDFNVGICEAVFGNQIDELYSNSSLARKNIAPGSAEKVVWFNEKLKEEQLWERYVEENMEAALEKGELHVYLQPKYHAKTKRLGGAEALIRWISPTEGFIGPGRFIPIFEKNGFITKIDDFMLSSVAKLQAKWAQEGCNVVPISVNISRAHFTQEDLAEHICQIVESSGAPKELIELELTESAFFEDKDMLIHTVEKLKKMGFSVSMDDFGAGYSSLNSLKDLQLDVLKIDADFFRGREENEERGSLIVSETIHLAQNLGMTTVAEGIESAEQVEFLAESGCDLIQGFYFAKPMPIADYEKKMEEDRQ